MIVKLDVKYIYFISRVNNVTLWKTPKITALKNIRVIDLIPCLEVGS